MRNNFKSNLKFKPVKQVLNLIIVVSLILTNCVSPPLTVNITELSACKGWNKAGKPIEISKNFSVNEKRIFACGYLQTNDPPITLSVNWYYEDRLIYRETIRDVKDYFYSSLERTKGVFQEGNYKIEVVVGKKPVRWTEFSIKQP